MFHTHPALVDAIRHETYGQIARRHGVPGDDFDGVVPQAGTKRARRHPRRQDV